MPGCPFAGKSAPADGDDGDVDSDCASDASDTPGADVQGPSDKKGRTKFSYKKDPVSWFFQNQILGEEDFQKRRADLRATARHQLDNVFAKKGKRLIIDSDEDDFDIGSSELSAWDSDVASMASLGSAVREWRDEASFGAPAEASLQIAIAALVAAAAYCAWVSLSAMTSAGRYWGIIHNGWVPAAAFAAGALVAAMATAWWFCMGRCGKRVLFWFQAGMQLAYAAVVGLAFAAYLMPTAMDGHFKTSAACDATRGAAVSSLCQYLPAIEDELGARIRSVLRGCCLTAAGCVAVLVLSSWYAWELCHVEKRATKHKRRRRQRKNRIPWDKIKVEDIKLVSSCGTGASRTAAIGGRGAANRGAGPGPGPAMGGCPLAGMMGGGGGGGAGASQGKKDN